MIQRIQTLYLLIAAILMVLMLVLPLATFLGGDQEFVLKAFGLQTVPSMGGYVYSTIYMGIIIAMAAVLPVINIFLFKKRILQVRLCFMELVLLGGAQVFAIYYLYHTAKSFKTIEAMVGMSAKYSIVAFLPFLAMIFVWLANRAILKDELLVRSVDRIR